MPRDGSNVYHRPPGTDGVPNTTISSAAYNVNVADVEQDLNLPRPIVAGGTGATNADAALSNLSGEKASQIVTNYGSQVWMAGSFSSAATATGSPVAGHGFAGVAYKDSGGNWILEARDLAAPYQKYLRIQSGGTWGSWTGNESPQYVLKAGDTMTGPLLISNSTLSIGGATPAGMMSPSTIGGQIVSAFTWFAFNSYYTTTWKAIFTGYSAQTSCDPSTGTLTVYSGSNVAADAATTQTAIMTLDKGGSALLTGNLTARGNGVFRNLVAIDKTAAAETAELWGRLNGVVRWRLVLGDGTAEGGTADGSNFAIDRCDNSGTFIDTPFYIARNTGQVSFNKGILSTAATGPAVQFGGQASYGFFADGGNIALRTYDNTGGVYFQRNAGAFLLAQMAANGDFTIGGAVATKTTGTTWANPSDARIKRDVRDYPVGLESLSKLRPVMYKFKPETRYNDDILAGTHVGLVAQEAELVMPDIVTTKPLTIGDITLEDFKIVDPSNVIFALINAVKELKTRVEALEGDMPGPPNASVP
jgi:hypothetical protein